MPIRGNELSDLSATSGAIFFASKLQEIFIRRHQEVCSIDFDLATEREAGALRQVEPMRTGRTLSLGFSSAKNLPPATSDKCPSEKSPFGKIALDIGQDELSANVSHRMRKKGLKQDSHQ